MSENAADDSMKRRLSCTPAADPQARFDEERRLRDAVEAAEEERFNELWVRIRADDPDALIVAVQGVPVRRDVAEMFLAYPTPPKSKRRRRARPP